MDGLRFRNMPLTGHNAIMFLTNGQKKVVRIKCGTKRNFLEWGKKRQSFILGPHNDIMASRFIDTAIKHYDIFLTGYEIEEGILAPYAMIYWPLFIRQVYGKQFLKREPNNGEPFAWIKHESLSRSVICSMNKKLF